MTPTTVAVTETPSETDEGETGGTAACDPVRFQESVVLSKGEVFGACQALADADRVLLKIGGKSEASALGDLFELLEARLASPTRRILGAAM